MADWLVHRPGRPSPWLARFQPKGSRVVSRSFKTKREAEVWLKLQAVDSVRGEWVDPRRGRLTVADYSEAWMAGRRIRPSTLAQNQSVLDSLILPHLGRRPLNSLTPEEIRRWLAALEAAGKAPATVAKAWQIFSAMVGQAVDDGRIARSPLPRRPGLPAPDRRDMHILTPDEVAVLADAIDPRYRMLVVLAGYSGMRWGEVAGLRVENVDLLRRQVRVAATLTDVRGVVALGPPKTKRSARTITLPRSVAQELGEHIGRFPGDGFLFTGPEGGPLRVSNFRRRAWAPAVREAGLEPLTFHDLRHTHAAWLIAAGEHAKLIADRLGHSSIGVTMNTYGHLMPGLDEQAADRLDVHAAASTRR